MYSIVYVYVVNRSNKSHKCGNFSCLDCDFKYFSRKKVKKCRQNDFNVCQFYRVKGNLFKII